MRFKPDEHAPERKKLILPLKWAFALILCISVTHIIQEMKTFNAMYLKTSGFDLILDAPNPDVSTNSNETPPPPTQQKAEENRAAKEATDLNTAKAPPPPPTEPKQEENATATDGDKETTAFKRYDKVVIATKIHGPNQWLLVEQSICLLHFAYNHKLLYDVIVFYTEDVEKEKVEELQKAIAPSKLTMVKDNLGSLQAEIAALTPVKRDLFLERCGVTDPVNMTWWDYCNDGRINYNWQAEFRSVRVWEHPALENYRYMFWLDSDGFPTRPFEKDPIEYFIENEAVIMFENFPQGGDRGRFAQSIVNNFNATACDLRLENGHLERNLITREEFEIVKSGNKEKAVKCGNTRIPMIHGFGHITDLDFYRQPKVINGLKGLLGNCFLCRSPDDQLAVTVPAAIYAPEKSLDMRSHGFNLGIFHNSVLDGKDKFGPPKSFAKYWNDAGGKNDLPDAIGVCKVTAGSRR